MEKGTCCFCNHCLPPCPCLPREACQLIILSSGGQGWPLVRAQHARTFLWASIFKHNSNTNILTTQYLKQKQDSATNTLESFFPLSVLRSLISLCALPSPNVLHSTLRGSGRFQEFQVHSFYVLNADIIVTSPPWFSSRVLLVHFIMIRLALYFIFLGTFLAIITYFPSGESGECLLLFRTTSPYSISFTISHRYQGLGNIVHQTFWNKGGVKKTGVWWGDTTLMPLLGDGKKDSAAITAEALRDTSHSNLELAATTYFPQKQWWLNAWQTTAYIS